MQKIISYSNFRVTLITNIHYHVADDNYSVTFGRVMKDTERNVSGEVLRRDVACQTIECNIPKRPVIETHYQGIAEITELAATLLALWAAQHEDALEDMDRRHQHALERFAAAEAVNAAETA